MEKVVKRSILLIAFVFAFLLGIEAIHAETYVVSNSENWRDVYSVIHYSNLKGVGSDFLVSTKHGPLLMGGISKNNDVRVVSSRTKPFVFNYASMMTGQDFRSAEEYPVDNANLELIEELGDINNFVIIGNNYGYDAIAVAPYAIIKRSWVFFADRTTLAEIESVLGRRNVGEVVIYGFVDRDVRGALAQYNPIIINTGDRFKDNIEIVKLYKKIKPNAQQVALSNGEFIEKELMSGMEPVLFTGKDNVPTQIQEYLKSSDIEVGVLVGSDLVGAATNIRRSTGISVIVKFARGARAPAGSISNVEGLDLFYVPSPSFKLDISSVKYNRANSQLYVTYKSESNAPVYLQGVITIKGENGESQKVGDSEALFIAPNGYLTANYSLTINGDKLKAGVYTLYGETPTALERVLEKTLDLEYVDVLDSCMNQLTLDKIKYSKPKQIFIVSLTNNADVDCYASVELRDVIIDGVKKTVGSEGAVIIPAGKSGNVKVVSSLINEDFRDNPIVNVFVHYGERQDSLVNTLIGKLELKIESISAMTIVLIVVGLIVLLLIIFFLIKRRKDDEDY